MSAYRSSVKGEVEFDGELVRYELKRITMEDALQFRTQSNSEAGSTLQKYLVSMDEIRDADGNAIPRETIFTEFYFGKLVSAMLNALMETGSVPKAKSDPSEGSLPASSQAVGSP